MRTILFRIPPLLAFACSFWLVLELDSVEQGKKRVEQSSSEPSGAFQALTFWTQSRAYPYDDIPAERYYQAFEYSKLRFPTEPAMNSGQMWESIGPTNNGGRTIGVAFNPLNPNTVFAGSASGGLWRSNNGGIGSDWRRVNTGFPVLGVMAIAIDPIDTNNIYIGTGETYRYQGALGGTVIRTTRGSYGIGILKSTNGGQTWSRCLDWSYALQRGVQMIRINPLNPRTIFAATSEGIYKSTNAGATWDSVLSVLMGEDILIHPQDTNKVLASCGNFATPDAGLYRSTNGGTSWTPITAFPRFSGKTLLDIYASIPNVVYASVADSTTGVGGLWRSTDFGLTWVLLNTGTPAGVQGWYSHFVAVHPNDSTQIVWGGVNILKSTNGGLTFVGSSGSYFDHHSFGKHPTNPNILCVVNDDGIYRSTNFGASFTNVSGGLLTLQFYNGFSNSQTDSLLALGQVQDHIPGYMYRGSTTWTRSAVDECGWTAINPLNDFTMYAINRSGGTISKSTNRGTSFSSSGSFSGVGSWNSPIVISPSNPNVLYVGKDKIYKTTNAGANWTATNNNLVLDGNPALSIAMTSTSSDTVFVGTAPVSTRAHIFRTTNGGTSWTDVTGTVPDRYPNDIAVDPNSSRTVYVVFGGFGTGHVWKSTDAGANWTDITGNLPDVPTTAIFIDPLNSNYVYVGNDISVYVSTDAGSTWNAFNNGLPDAVLISDLSITASNRTLRLTTHGNGVFQRPLLQPTVSVKEQSTVELEFKLEQNYPNPFNPTTEIRFGIGDVGFVTLKVYDILGQEVATLVNERKGPGTYTVTWDARNIPSGVYSYRLMTKDFVQTKKMLLIK